MKQKRHRTTFNQYQLSILEEAFKQNSYPNPAFREVLASKTSLDSSRVQVWFQNRRAKHKKQLNQAMRCFANSHHHHQHHHSLMDNVSANTDQIKLEQCAALQQQMALDLHLHSANQLNILQQQQSSPSINSTLNNGFVLDQRQQQQQQDLYVGANDNESSQLDVASNSDLQLQIDDDNDRCNNLLYNQHWLNCNAAAVAANQQQQQEAMVDNLASIVDQQVMQQQQQQQQQDHQSSSSSSSFVSSHSLHQIQEPEAHEQDQNQLHEQSNLQLQLQLQQQQQQLQQNPHSLSQQNQPRYHHHQSLFAICAQQDSDGASEFCQRLNNQLNIAAAAVVANQQQSALAISAMSASTPVSASNTPSPVNQALVQNQTNPLTADGSSKVEPDFQHYQQRQQCQKQNQYYNYYKQIGSQLRSTVEYLH